MATKAEQFRYEAERSGKKRAAKVRRHKRVRSGSARTESRHAEKKAAYRLEDSVGRPSRKSSRKASNRQKTDTKFSGKRRVAETRPPRPTGRA
jgi:hypothetical protein